MPQHKVSISQFFDIDWATAKTNGPILINEVSLNSACVAGMLLHSYIALKPFSLKTKKTKRLKKSCDDVAFTELQQKLLKQLNPN